MKRERQEHFQVLLIIKLINSVSLDTVRCQCENPTKSQLCFCHLDLHIIVTLYKMDTV